MKEVSKKLSFPIITGSLSGGLIATLLLKGFASPLAVLLDTFFFALFFGALATLVTSLMQWRFGKALEGKQRLQIDEYNQLFDERVSASERQSKYEALVNSYYDLSTDFYEYGWGDQFHFANKAPQETFKASLARHEHLLASRLNLSPGGKALDVGCGIGGPAREISRFTGARVTGLNNNAYQVSRARAITEKQGLSDQVNFVKGDFMKIDAPDNTYDAVYAIEATCHAPNRVGVFSEMLRVLKPGGRFAVYEWCTTPSYDASNPEHQHIKHLIEIGNGLPDLAPTTLVADALAEAGFNVLEARDVGPVTAAYPEPWYGGLQAKWSIRNFRMTSFGRTVTTALVSVLEALRIAPQGALKTQQMLIKAADGVVAGGEAGIFTPMFLCVAEKPL